MAPPSIEAVMAQDRLARGGALYRAQAGRMNLITTLLAFIVALGSLITLHELGHYLVARGAA
jgi:hypothetical protein